MPETPTPTDEHLDPATRAELRAIIRALPPLTDDQCRLLADTIVQAHLEHARGRS